MIQLFFGSRPHYVRLAGTRQAAATLPALEEEMVKALYPFRAFAFGYLPWLSYTVSGRCLSFGIDGGLMEYFHLW
jgi:hypothetical protein